jgi:hypothetical protein
MANYRLYSLGGDGRIGLAEWIRADSDEEAIAQARQMKLCVLTCEIWCKDRLVATLRPGAPSGAAEVDRSSA